MLWRIHQNQTFPEIEKDFDSVNWNFLLKSQYPSLLPIGSLHILESIREVSFYGSDREVAYQQSTLKY